MSDLVEFLNARLFEDEAFARPAFEGSIVAGSDDPGYVGPYLQRFTPARVLREAAADRMLLHSLQHPDPLQGPEYGAGLRLAAMFRATVWNDHPDYDQDWKP